MSRDKQAWPVNTRNTKADTRVSPVSFPFIFAFCFSLCVVSFLGGVGGEYWLSAVY
jgi:hypothetical protein